MPPRYGSKKSRTRTVPCSFEELELENDEGYPVDGVRATCTRCGHVTESFGTSDASYRRCLGLMREECPRGEHNWYIDDEEDEEEHGY